MVLVNFIILYIFYLISNHLQAFKAYKFSGLSTVRKLVSNNLQHLLCNSFRIKQQNTKSLYNNKASSVSTHSTF